MKKKTKKKPYQPRGGVPAITSEEVHEFLETLSPETLSKLNHLADAVVDGYKQRTAVGFNPPPFGRQQALELILVSMTKMDYLSKDRVASILAEGDQYASS